MSFVHALIAVAGFAFVLAPTAGVRAQAASDTRFQGVTLRVATWGGATRDGLRDYVASEIERHGGKVEFVIGSPQDNLAKLIAARGQVPFDVIEFLGTMTPEITGRNLLADMNVSSMPNVQALPAGEYTKNRVATWITEEMIVYNKDKFKENGIPVPHSLKDLTNPKLSGRVMIPDIASGGGIESLGAFAITAGGNETNITPGLKLISDIPNVRFWKSGGEVITQFKSGDIWAAVAHAGWAVRTAQAGVPVATVPARLGDKEGMVKEGYIGVVKGTKNLQAAEFFINTYLSAEAQYRFAEKVGVVPMVREARDRMKGTPVIKDLVILDPTKINNMARLDPDKLDLSKWNEEWSRSVSR